MKGVQKGMFGVKIRAWGNYACFTRPELKVERVSYDIMTPSAAKGFIDSIYWKPSIEWVIDRITVLKPIRFINFNRNEINRITSLRNVLSNKEDRIYVDNSKFRAQRSTLLLTDVDYVIEAHFEFTGDEDNNSDKHHSIITQRASKGKCHNIPYFGLKELVANFELLTDTPESELNGEIDLGLMLHSIDFKSGNPRFFRAIMKDGVVNIPPINSKEVLS